MEIGYSLICRFGFGKRDESSPFFDLHRDVKNFTKLAEMFLEEIFRNFVARHVNGVTRTGLLFGCIARLGFICELLLVTLICELLVKILNATRFLLYRAGRGFCSGCRHRTSTCIGWGGCGGTNVFKFAGRAE
uniref:Uncharacterized protein n=1 Tax=Anopheles atroparvus TaxID=41427 RepID=A0AAG5D7K5_ANOAO